MTDLHRRQYLIGGTTAVVSAALAGCSDILGDDGDGGGPEYEESQREEMLLSVDAFPDEWRRNDEFNENFDASYLNGDGSIVVMTTVEVFDDESGAEERMEQARAGVSDPNEYTIGDDSFWAARNEIACTLFRHGNAVGQACAVRESGSGVVPDQSRSQEYASELFDHWQDL